MPIFATGRGCFARVCGDERFVFYPYHLNLVRTFQVTEQAQHSAYSKMPFAGFYFCCKGFCGLFFAHTGCCCCYSRYNQGKTFATEDRKSIDLEEVEKFAKYSAASDFISKMPEGYDLVGERDVGLSGGQKQRISLARALAVRPSILILDDTTSAVDMETEKQIQEALRASGFFCVRR